MVTTRSGSSAPLDPPAVSSESPAAIEDPSTISPPADEVAVLREQLRQTQEQLQQTLTTLQEQRDSAASAGAHVQPTANASIEDNPTDATEPVFPTEERSFNPFESDFIADIPDDARFDARELRRQTLNLWARAEQSGISRMAEHLDNREMATRLTFEANASDIFEFLQQVDSLRIDMEWDDATTLRTLKRSLCSASRNAVQVVNLRRVRAGGRPMSYLETRRMMYEAYGKGVSETEHYLRMYEKFRQLSQETVEAAALRFEGIVFRLERACPEQAPPSHAILRTFRRGLHKDLQTEITGYANLENLTLPKLVKEAGRLERALAKRKANPNKETKHFAANVSTSPTNACTYCKKKGHTSEICRIRLRQCFKCGGGDHQIAQCPDATPATSNKPTPSRYSATPNTLLQPRMDHEGNTPDENGPAVISVTIGETVIPALLDTGSGLNFISQEWLNRIRPPPRRATAPTPLEVGDAFGRQTSLQQSTTVTITLNGNAMDGIRLWVAEELSAGLLLGREFLVKAKARFDYKTGLGQLEAFGVRFPIAETHDATDPDCSEDCSHLSPLGPVPEAVKDLRDVQGDPTPPITSSAQLKHRMRPPDETRDDPAAAQARDEIADAIWTHYRRLLDTKFGDTKHFIRIPVIRPHPISRKPHPVSCKEREVIRNEMKKLEEQGVIERTTSPWAAPVLIVPKANGKLRPCVDYRALNEVISSTAYPVPNAKNILQNLRGATYRTVIDIRGAFWNLWVHPEDRDRTAFVTPDAQYRYLRMPMGITPGPAEWQSYMDKVLLPVAGKGVFAYLDDIIICSQGTAREHATLVREVLKLLHDHDLRIQPEKCQWLATHARYLGHVVSKDGIHVQPEKVAAVTSFPPPTKLKDVRAFLGLTSYYRAFMPRYSTVAAPLNKLLKKNQPFTWGSEQTVAFTELCRLLTSAPVLEHYDPANRTLILQTDASKVGISAVLTQRDSLGTERPVMYVSRTMQEAERNYPVREQEMLAIVFGVQQLRDLLHGQQFIIQTDHESLKYLLAGPLPSARIRRWMLKLAPFQYTVEYRKGELNTNADVLSRYPIHTAPNPEQMREAEAEEADLMRVKERFQVHAYTRSQRTRERQAATDNPDANEHHITPQPTTQGSDYSAADKGSDPPREKHAGAARSEHVDIASTRVEGNSAATEEYTASQSSEPANDTAATLLTEPTEQLKLAIFREYHGTHWSGHQGVDKTLQRIRRKYDWPSLRRELQEFIKTCEICQRTAGPPTRSTRPPIQPMVAPVQGIGWGIDYVGPFNKTKSGNQYILHMEQLQDGGVWTELVPTREATAEYAARGLMERVISRTGAPAWIVSDQGKAFTGEIIQHLCEMLHIKKIQTTAYHPQSNGATERVHRDLNKFLKQFVNSRQDDWDTLLPAFEMVRRASDIRGTGVSQAALRFGKELELPTELLANGGRNSHEDKFRYIGKLRSALAQAQAAYSTSTDKQRRRDAKIWEDAMVKYREKEYEVGDYVMLYTPTCEDGLRPKLATMWRGPYEVIAKPSPVNYTIRHLMLAGKPEQTVYAHRLKRYCPRNDGETQVAEHERAQALDLELADQPGEVLRIAAEKVVGERVHNRKKQYRIRWRGYSRHHDTWEPD
jgi:hypothetical protein